MSLLCFKRDGHIVILAPQAKFSHVFYWKMHRKQYGTMGHLGNNPNISKFSPAVPSKYRILLKKQNEKNRIRQNHEK